jgi:uncharacterized protein (DUF924 family)
MSLNDFITEFIGNKKFWFSKSSEQDAYLTDKYSHLLDTPVSDNHLHLTILYDQLPRHVFRNEQKHMVANAQCGRDERCNSCGKI